MSATDHLTQSFSTEIIFQGSGVKLITGVASNFHERKPENIEYSMLQVQFYCCYICGYFSFLIRKGNNISENCNTQV